MANKEISQFWNCKRVSFNGMYNHWIGYGYHNGGYVPMYDDDEESKDGKRYKDWKENDILYIELNLRLKTNNLDLD